MAVQRFSKASKRNGAIAACACALLACCWQPGYRSRVAAKSALNAKNLEALGLERLAALLIEISAGNAAAKRRLRMELAGAQSSAELAKEVRKRLTIIARSRSFVDWQGARSLAGDLDIQRRAIVETVAKADSTEALDLLWRFMALAPAVLERCDDSSGTVIGVFHEACADIGDVALMAKADPKTLADQAFTALTVNDYGQFDQLIRVLAPSLGQAGLEQLKQRMIDLSNRPVMKPAEKDRVKIGWSSSGPIFADEMAERSRLSTVRLALTEIADASPKPPPTSGAITRTLCPGIPSRSASRSRMIPGICDESVRVSERRPRSYSAMLARFSIATGALRWKRNWPPTRTGAPIISASMSPRTNSRSARTFVPASSCSSGAFCKTANCGSTTDVKGLYATSTRSSASSARYRLLATTATIGSPT